MIVSRLHGLFKQLDFFAFFLYALFFDWKLLVTVESLFYLLLIGVVEVVASSLLMKMHAHSELSISTILTRTRMLWVPLFAFLFVGEVLLPIEYLGIAILFIGVSVVSSPKKLFVDKGARYANTAAIAIALNIVLYKLAMPYASGSLILAALAFPSIFLMPILMKNAKKRIKVNLQTKLPLKLLTVGLNVISLIFFALAMQNGEASKVNAVYQGMLVFAVLAGIIFLHERKDIGKKIIGTVVTLIGVILLSLY